MKKQLAAPLALTTVLVLMSTACIIGPLPDEYTGEVTGNVNLIDPVGGDVHLNLEPMDEDNYRVVGDMEVWRTSNHERILLGTLQGTFYEPRGMLNLTFRPHDKNEVRSVVVSAFFHRSTLCFTGHWQDMGMTNLSGSGSFEACARE